MIALHVCCGPCAISFIEGLKDFSDQMADLVYSGKLCCVFYNPNIHPENEYKMRLEGAKEVAAYYNLEFVEIPSDLNSYVKAIDGLGKRCKGCYRLRLKKIADWAETNLNIDAFTSTLLVSPYQDFDYILDLGIRFGVEKNLRFLKLDFRSHFRPGIKKARELRIWVQKYCGCMYSLAQRQEGTK